MNFLNIFCFFFLSDSKLILKADFEDFDQIPDFIITGVNKCGTSAAARFLFNHPDLDRALGEPNFFNIDENYNKGLEWYKSQFPKKSKNKKIIFEKTPSYYKSPIVQKRIKSMNPNIKLINIGN